VERALASCGPDGEPDDMTTCAALVDYGHAANVWQAAGDDVVQLLQEAKARLRKVRALLSDYLDQSQNRAGETGWQWIGSQATHDKAMRR
jgi:hypothetical protein